MPIQFHRPPVLETLFSVAETAAALGVHPISIYKALAGDLKMPVPVSVRIGRSIRFREKDVVNFLNAHSFAARSRSIESPRVNLPQPKRKGRPTKADQIKKRLQIESHPGGAA